MSTTHPTKAPHTRREWAVLPVSLVLLGLLGVSGCSGESDTAPPPVPVTTASASAPAPAGSGPSDTPGPSETPGPSASAMAPTPSPLPSIGTRRGSAIDGAHVDVTLNSVVVDQAMMTVTWTVRNAGSRPWRIADYFFAGYFFDTGSAKSSTDAARGLARADGQADGVYVLDRKHSRRYLAGRDKDARCACSTGLALAGLDPGGEAVLEAQYQAPPADVVTVDVVLPHVGSFRDVSVTRG